MLARFFVLSVYVIFSMCASFSFVSSIWAGWGNDTRFSEGSYGYWGNNRMTFAPEAHMTPEQWQRSFSGYDSHLGHSEASSANDVCSGGSCPAVLYAEKNSENSAQPSGPRFGDNIIWENDKEGEGYNTCQNPQNTFEVYQGTHQHNTSPIHIIETSASSAPQKKLHRNISAEDLLAIAMMIIAEVI